MKTVIPADGRGVEAIFSKTNPEGFTRDDEAWWHFQASLMASYNQWFRAAHPEAFDQDGRPTKEYCLLGMSGQALREWRSTQPRFYEFNRWYYILQGIDPIDGDVTLLRFEPSEVQTLLNESVMERPSQLARLRTWLFS
jgi:hypothetical protein